MTEKERGMRTPEDEEKDKREVELLSETEVSLEEKKVGCEAEIKALEDSLKKQREIKEQIDNEIEKEKRCAIS